MNPGLRIVREPPVLEVVIDRPKANAIDAATSRLMGEAFRSFRDDPRYRVAILTGAGDRFFSAGWDLAAASDGESYEADWGPGGFGGFTELEGLNKPVICAVNGIAAGGGFEVVLAADLVLAADTAQFLFPEALLGFPPDTGVVRLPRHIPPVVAKEMLLTGRRMGMEEAARWGLVNQVVPAAELPETARRLARRVYEAAPLATEAILEMIRATSRMGVADAMAHIRAGKVASYRAALDSPDAIEGPRAFAEKRPPRWTGA
ncbi:MAG: crotonobetainyl-CoA hydratase [Acidimicrobiia bacterium]|nr:crotonobetainyl-CoA hydratase [Acidimicrobiia bacterium]MYJ15952.1 crotonobetainyl-CoA hydratase [Acidimicrobiia bacterium]